VPINTAQKLRVLKKCWAPLSYGSRVGGFSSHHRDVWGGYPRNTKYVSVCPAWETRIKVSLISLQNFTLLWAYGYSLISSSII